MMRFPHFGENAVVRIAFATVDHVFGKEKIDLKRANIRGAN